MKPSRTVTVAMLLGTLTVGLEALAAPRPGQPLPAFSGSDLQGARHDSREFVGRPTMLVVITDRAASNAMRAWYGAADVRVPRTVARESVVSLGLPFFVSEGLARSRARGEVPRSYWDDTLLDRDASMARRLGLARSNVPYVFALDAQGRVMAAAHAPVGTPAAAAVWRALGAR